MCKKGAAPMTKQLISGAWELFCLFLDGTESLHQLSRFLLESWSWLKILKVVFSTRNATKVEGWQSISTLILSKFPQIV